MKLVFAFFFVLAQFFVFGQDTIIFKNSEVLAIDSINNCSTHYSIKFRSATDTISSIIAKNHLHKSASVLIGRYFDIETIQPDSILIGVNGVNYNYKPIRAFVTHMPDGSMSTGTITWSRKRRRKEIFKISTTSYYTGWTGRILVVENLNEATAP